MHSFSVAGRDIKDDRTFEGLLLLDNARKVALGRENAKRANGFPFKSSFLLIFYPPIFYASRGGENANEFA